jgi:GNAT superfamily N-acetyltransferase
LGWEALACKAKNDWIDLLGIIQPQSIRNACSVVSSIIYRQIAPFETAGVAALACEVFDQFVAPHYQPDGILEFHRYASADALAQRHESGHVTLVAEHSGELVGMLHLRKPCHVAMLFVRSSFQHKGIGRKLIATAGALVGEESCEFTLNSSPNAVAAYEHLGFHAIGPEQCVRGIRFTPMRKQKRSSRKRIRHGA